MIPSEPSHMHETCLQSGVIPFRIKNGKLSVLLITSRRKKRWIIPKGYIEIDLDPPDSAAKEAFEEAGVLGRLHRSEIGQYQYTKWGRNFLVQVYMLEVSRELLDWPEASFRKRKWLSPTKASDLVKSPELKEMLRAVPDILPK